jgi:hypothetical protein
LSGGNPGAGKVLVSDPQGNASWAEAPSTWNKAGSDLWYSAGKVGVGTDKPGAALTVQGGLAVQGAPAAWGLPEWKHRADVLVDNPGTALAEFQLTIQLDTAALVKDGKLKADCSDLRFTAGDAKTLLPYWLESGCNTATTLVWLRAPQVLAGQSYFFLYGANPAASSASSLKDTFDQVKDFSTFKANWRFSGIVGGMLKGWEDPLTVFAFNDSAWSLVDISTDFVPDVNSQRWLVRRELFLLPGDISYSGSVDDDEVWSLIPSVGTFAKIGGDENDADGSNAHGWQARPFTVSKEGRYIWAGRGQEGGGGDHLMITSIDAGLALVYQRKTTTSALKVTVGTGLGGGEAQALLFADPAKMRVGVGTSQPGYTLHVAGSFAASQKNFVISHPDRPGRLLVHSALEGPEVGVYYRGEARLQRGRAVVELPRFFESLCREEGRSVQLTPLGGWSPLYVDGPVADGRFTVRTGPGGRPDQAFFWEVKAVRADQPPLVAEP